MNFNVKPTTLGTIFKDKQHYNSQSTPRKVAVVAMSNPLGEYCISHLDDFSNPFAHLGIDFFVKQDNQINTNIIPFPIDNYELCIFVGCSKENLFETFASNLNSNAQKLKYFSNTIPSEILDVIPDCDFIGFQRHLVNRETIARVEGESMDSMSLGLLRSNADAMEPALRNTTCLHFDMAALRLADNVNNVFSQPTGLNAEEMCQIFRYSGDSPNIKLVSFDTNGIKFCSPQSPEPVLIAESIWYLLEGFNNQTALKSNEISKNKYMVHMDDMEEPLIFTLDSATGKWWISLGPEDDNSPQIACTSTDYNMAVKGQLSDKLYRKLFY